MSQNVGLSEVLTMVSLQSSNPGSETGRCRELQFCADADSVDDDTAPPEFKHFTAIYG